MLVSAVSAAVYLMLEPESVYILYKKVFQKFTIKISVYQMPTCWYCRCCWCWCLLCYHCLLLLCVIVCICRRKATICSLYPLYDVLWITISYPLFYTLSGKRQRKQQTLASASIKHRLQQVSNSNIRCLIADGYISGSFRTTCNKWMTTDRNSNNWN